MRKAWIENDRIRDICPGDPFALYHADVAKLYDTDVPDEAVNGDGWVNGKLVKLEQTAQVEPPEPTPAPISIIGPIAFQMLFTVDELTALEAAKATDLKVRVFSKLLDDPRTDEVNRNLPQVQDYLRYCEAAGYLSPGRAEVILYGKLI